VLSALKSYGRPAELDGHGQVIGVIELGGGFREDDLQKYFDRLHLARPNVVSVSVDGGSNAPTTAESADGQVEADLEIAGTVAPNANFRVYFAPNIEKGFADAIDCGSACKRNPASGVIGVQKGTTIPMV
jgi:kumamolisin